MLVVTEGITEGVTSAADVEGGHEDRIPSRGSHRGPSDGIRSEWPPEALELLTVTPKVTTRGTNTNAIMRV